MPLIERHLKLPTIEPKLNNGATPFQKITEHLNNQGSTLVMYVKMEKKKLMNKIKILKKIKREKP